MFAFDARAFLTGPPPRRLPEILKKDLCSVIPQEIKKPWPPVFTQETRPPTQDRPAQKPTKLHLIVSEKPFYFGIIPCLIIHSSYELALITLIYSK